MRQFYKYYILQSNIESFIKFYNDVSNILSKNIPIVKYLIENQYQIDNKLQKELIYIILSQYIFNSINLNQFRHTSFSSQYQELFNYIHFDSDYAYRNLEYNLIQKAQSLVDTVLEQLVRQKIITKIYQKKIRF